MIPLPELVKLSKLGKSPSEPYVIEKPHWGLYHCADSNNCNHYGYPYCTCVSSCNKIKGWTCCGSRDFNNGFGCSIEYRNENVDAWERVIDKTVWPSCFNYLCGK